MIYTNFDIFLVNDNNWGLQNPITFKIGLSGAFNIRFIHAIKYNKHVIFVYFIVRILSRRLAAKIK